MSINTPTHNAAALAAGVAQGDIYADAALVWWKQKKNVANSITSFNSSIDMSAIQKAKDKVDAAKAKVQDKLDAISSSIAEAQADVNNAVTKAQESASKELEKAKDAAMKRMGSISAPNMSGLADAQSNVTSALTAANKSMTLAIQGQLSLVEVGSPLAGYVDLAAAWKVKLDDINAAAPALKVDLSALEKAKAAADAAQAKVQAKLDSINSAVSDAVTDAQDAASKAAANAKDAAMKRLSSLGKPNTSGLQTAKDEATKAVSDVTTKVALSTKANLATAIPMLPGAQVLYIAYNLELLNQADLIKGAISSIESSIDLSALEKAKASAAAAQAKVAAKLDSINSAVSDAVTDAQGAASKAAANAKDAAMKRLGSLGKPNTSGLEKAQAAMGSAKEKALSTIDDLTAVGKGALSAGIMGELPTALDEAIPKASLIALGASTATAAAKIAAAAANELSGLPI